MGKYNPPRLQSKKYISKWSHIEYQLQEALLGIKYDLYNASKKNELNKTTPNNKIRLVNEKIYKQKHMHNFPRKKGKCSTARISQDNMVSQNAQS